MQDHSVSLGKLHQKVKVCASRAHCCRSLAQHDYEIKAFAEVIHLATTLSCKEENMNNLLMSEVANNL